MITLERGDFVKSHRKRQQFTKDPTTFADVHVIIFNYKEVSIHLLKKHFSSPNYETHPNFHT